MWLLSHSALTYFPWLWLLISVWLSDPRETISDHLYAFLVGHKCPHKIPSILNTYFRFQNALEAWGYYALCVLQSSVGSLKRESFLHCPSKRLNCIFLYSINICWISAGYTQSSLLGSLGDTEMSPTWILLSSCSHSNRGERAMKTKSQSTRFKVQDNQCLMS